MKFIGIQKHHGTSLGVLVGSEALDLSACGDILPAALELPPSLRGLLEIGDSALAAARQIADEAAKPSVSERLRAKGALTALDKITLAAPVPEPGMILSCGMNYHEHLKEMNTPVPDKPTAFYKSITAIIGPGAPIVLPKMAPDMVDWEGEFSVVIGKHKLNQAYIGTNRDQSLSLGVNREPQLEINTDGLTTVKKLRVGLHRISHDTQVPGWSGTRGDLVLNTSPGPDRVFAWVCLGAHRWQTLKSAE